MTSDWLWWRPLQFHVKGNITNIMDEYIWCVFLFFIYLLLPFTLINMFYKSHYNVIMVNILYTDSICDTDIWHSYSYTPVHPSPVLSDRIYIAIHHPAVMLLYTGVHGKVMHQWSHNIISTEKVSGRVLLHWLDTSIPQQAAYHKHDFSRISIHRYSHSSTKLRRSLLRF